MTTLAGVPAPARSGGLHRHRDFRLLWAGQAVSAVGSNVTAVALPLVAVAVLDASTFQVAVLTAAAWLPWLLVGLPAGAWVDRVRRRPVMIVCDLVSAALFLSVPAAALLDLLTVGHLLVVALGAGLARVFFETADQVYLPVLLRPEEVPEGNAKLHATQTASYLVGPGLAGLIAQLAGAVTAVLLDALSFLVSALCLGRIRAVEPRPGRSDDPTSLRREVLDGLRFVVRDPYLRVLTVFGAASNIGLTGYQAVLVVFLVRSAELPAGLVGVLIGLASVGGLVGAALATRLARRLGSARALLLAALLTGPPALLIPLAGPGPRVLWLVLGGALVSLGVAVGNVVKGSFRQTYTPHRLLGRVTVSMQLLNYGTIPLAAVAAGALGAAWGPAGAIRLMTAGLALTPLILLIGPLRRRRDLPATPA
ncbi:MULTISPECIES: MFS transporter [Micromonospora]|uniref:MFS transporter n=1 Tax=Micromonospora solifontis TaxID=2487138 RepID=A0ABX9WD67_9ACTN|nr:MULTISPECIES: MFS transporter [Micromonospora]NES12145.1 MFS transporter [Micromonospora sp. PPF5-17B]NES38874.1 MFS transporter [Micromonospora solifontis]NES54372.1 MFS transporter [Micromonospora sp. PPF5-6]RNL92634.1 MFS transporter [Micromonospora solifontis]